MKKKCSLFFLFFLCCFLFSPAFLFAQTVGKKEARKAALRFLSERVGPTEKPWKLTNPRLIVDEGGDTLLYIFGRKKKEGIVILSADYRAEPVLCYSLGEVWREKEELPSASVYCIETYRAYVKAFKEQRTPASGASRHLRWEALLKEGPVVPSVRSRKILPFTTQWNQTKYYNDFCPVDFAARGDYFYHVPAGCGAVALAQVMRYYKYPSSGVGKHSYVPKSTPKYGELSADFTIGYNWAAMRDSATEHATPTARLIADCGVALEMDYKTNESSSSMQSVENALKTYFKYNPGLTFRWKNQPDSDLSDWAWVELIRNEIDYGRPVIYRDARGKLEGHVFVCYGYDGDFLLFNMGWGKEYAQVYFTSHVIDYESDPGLIEGVVPPNTTEIQEQKEIFGY